MIQARRTGYATFETPDLGRLIDYYTRVIGLVVVERSAELAFLATRTGLLAIELRRAASPRCVKIAFQVAPGEDFAEMSRQLSRQGIESELRSDPAPGTPRAIAFKDPNGTTIELFAEWQPLGLEQLFTGIAPLKLGHVAFIVPDPQVLTDFYVDVLGFRVSDWIRDAISFLRCNSDHHSANFFKGGSVGVHHIAFELTDFSQIRNASDVLIQNDIPVILGPLRTGPGHNVMVLHRNPDGHMVECYAELDQMKDEALGYFDPRPWHKDHPQRPKVWQISGADTTWGPPLPSSGEAAATEPAAGSA